MNSCYFIVTLINNDFVPDQPVAGRGMVESKIVVLSHYNYFICRSKCQYKQPRPNITRKW